MRTQDFIAKWARTGKTGKCASVFAETGAAYSYGYHYPLLIKIGERFLLNAQGYSNTTARHISYARSQADYTTFKTPTCAFTPEALKEHAEKEQAEYKEQLKGLRKNATKKRADLESKITTTESFIKYANTLITLKRKPYNYMNMSIVDSIIDFENGEMELEEQVELVQKLIDSGMAWNLQGSYGRMAMDFINAGLCTLGPKATRDAYGNKIPSIDEVAPGSKGSREYASEMRKD